MSEPNQTVQPDEMGEQQLSELLQIRRDKLQALRLYDQYRDLMVRVAGFTQYWCEIGKPIQYEVIYRTEYEEV